MTMAVAKYRGGRLLVRRFQICTSGRPYKIPLQVGAAGVWEDQVLPTDPIGSAMLNLTNLVSGSAIEIQDSTVGTSLYNGTAAGTTASIPLNVYTSGSTLNTLKVKVRKGTSSPFYQPWDTFVSLVVGTQSIYVSQLSDE